MGEVYRATDTNLARQVAIKVLPASVAADPDRLARFDREAKTLAALNHPNIAAIYGLEKSSGITALVMELVEGEDLSQRIARRAMPLAETLPIAREIAAALEAAHEQGIIHRDLKPANIKVRSDGGVKVLDFGLAKAMEPVGAMSASVSTSPTITTPAMTQAGMILGTAAYMAPEQARGKPADKRVDIWAFGCVVYEMLTGRRAFDGDDVATVLASVIKGEPDWAALPADVSMSIITLLRRCLQKERRDRIADIGVATFVLNHAAQLVERVDQPVAAPPPASVQRPQRWHHAAWTAAAVSISALLAGAGVWLLTRPASPPVVRTTVTTSGSAALIVNRYDRDVAITPDGSRIVYRGNNQLLVRALNRLEPTVLSGLGAPQGVFVSPDGQWVGFVDGATMKKVAIAGGPPETVCAIGGGPRGAAWGKDGTIIFATGQPSIGLLQVSAAGGEPTVLTKPDRERGEGDHLWPEFLPESDAVLFTITPANGNIENSQIAVLDLRTGTSKVLIRGGSHAYYIPTGHLLYSGAGILRAVPFNLGRREVVGTPAPVLEGVLTTPVGAADVAVAANGSLVYVQGAVGGMKQDVVSVDRQGRASALPGLQADTWRDVRVSPDGARVALANQNDIWIYDFARANSSRLTTDPARDSSPLWTRDGQRIVFTSMRPWRELFWRPADATGSDERLLTPGKELVDLLANGWSPEGRLLFTEVPRNLQNVIAQIAIERPSEVTVLVKNDFSNGNAAVSPDGHWVAYDSNVSAQQEIYVERYPELGKRTRISTGGGRIPLWSPNGRELFFSSLDSRQMLAVPVQSGPTLVAGPPRVLFEFTMAAPGGGGRPYDLAPDGRFLIIRSGQADAADGVGSNLIVVQNWFEELKRLVPTK